MADGPDAGFRPGSILGTRVVRTEDLSFLTRGAVYTEDLSDQRLADCLFLTFVRSAVPRGNGAAPAGRRACPVRGRTGGRRPHRRPVRRGGRRRTGVRGLRPSTGGRRSPCGARW